METAPPPLAPPPLQRELPEAHDRLDPSSEVFEEAYSAGHSGRLPALDEMEAFWKHPAGASAFREGLKEARFDFDPELVFDEGVGGGERGNVEDERLARVFASVSERLKAMRSSLFPDGVALSLDELREQHGEIEEQDIRLAAHTWSLDAELSGKAPPMELDERRLQALRVSFMERIEELDGNAERLHYEHALAVHAEPEDVWTAVPLDTVREHMRVVDLPARHQNVQRFVQVLFPELAPWLDRAGQSIRALSAAVGDLERHWTISQWRETRNLLGALAWTRACRGEDAAPALRAAVESIQGEFDYQRRAAAQRPRPWPAVQDRVSPPLAAVAAALALAEAQQGQRAGDEDPVDSVALREQRACRTALAGAWLSACAQAQSPQVRKALQEELQQRRAEHWVERERQVALGETPLVLSLLDCRPGRPERDYKAYSCVIEGLQRCSDADPELRERALEIAQAHYQRATRSLAEKRAELDEDLELAM